MATLIFVFALSRLRLNIPSSVLRLSWMPASFCCDRDERSMAATLRTMLNSVGGENTAPVAKRAAKLSLLNFLSLFRDLQKSTRFSGGGVVPQNCSVFSKSRRDSVGGGG